MTDLFLPSLSGTWGTGWGLCNLVVVGGVGVFRQNSLLALAPGCCPFPLAAAGHVGVYSRKLGGCDLWLISRLVKVCSVLCLTCPHFGFPECWRALWSLAGLSILCLSYLWPAQRLNFWLLSTFLCLIYHVASGQSWVPRFAWSMTHRGHLVPVYGEVPSMSPALPLKVTLLF